MVIIDVGASTSEFSTHVANFEAVFRVHAIEPINSNLEKIRDHPKIFKHNLALSNSKFNQAKLFVSENSELSSLIPICENLSPVWSNHLEESKVKKVINIKSITLKEFIESQEIDEIEFIKIDAQGLDFEILKSAGNAVSKINALCVETAYQQSLALYTGELGLAKLLAWLDKHNFTVVRIVPNGGGEANVFAYRNEFGLENYLKLEHDLEFSKIECLKIGNTRHSSFQMLRRRFWFIERRVQRIFKV